MNVSSVNNQSYFPIQFNSQQNTTPASSAGSTSNGVSSNLSSVAQFFNQLQQLSTQNPAAFQQITSQIAQQLTTAAQSATDPIQSAALNDLAANFTQASQTGQYSSLFSPTSTGASSAPAAAARTGGQHSGGGDPTPKPCSPRAPADIITITTAAEAATARNPAPNPRAS